MLLFCSDLDRTLLPNGPQPESPEARPRLRALGRHPHMALAYVSGRDPGLIQAAMREYALPLPRYAVGDVGTRIYAVDAQGVWSHWGHWEEHIAADWNGLDGPELCRLLSALPGLRVQPPERQARCKASFYVDPALPREALLQTVAARLEDEGLHANLVWSIDETRDQGLLDLLPERADKLQAIRFLMQETGHDPDSTVFAGDSGNDIAVLASEIPAVLVANATDSVRAQARAQAERAGQAPRLYLARGGLHGMNGHYAAGALEGLAHFHPQSADWMPLD